MRYQFIEDHRNDYPVTLLCRVMQVARSGYYAWIKQPKSARQKDNERLLGLIKQFWLESGGIYGYRKIHRDLRDIGERCGKHRVRRLMRLAGLRAQVGYRRPRQKSGPASVVAPNRLQQQFNVAEPNEAWVSDITHIRTHEGWLYLAVVMDLFSRRIVGWSMQATLKRPLVLEALEMAIKQRRPQPGLLHHSDRGSQYASHDYQAVLADNKMDVSMSRRGDCYDNAVVESFFGSLKTECIQDTVYSSRCQAKLALFDYMEVFYNRQRLHSTLGYIPPVEFERMNGVL